MTTKGNEFISLMLACLFCICVTAFGDTVDDRLDGMLDDYLGNPYPDPNAGQLKGRAGYAMVALHKGVDTTKANSYLNWIQDNYDVPDSTSWDFDSYWVMQMLLRAYIDPRCASNMTQSAKDDLEGMFWRYINKRSKMSDANGSVWVIAESENHDAMRKATFYLAAQVLMTAGGYNPNTDLDDGYTIREHKEAWENYWFEYFRQRAREGINCEIASPQYAKYTVACYYNIRDLTDLDDLWSAADNFITLYWADTAMDFVASDYTGIRGGAQTRCYKSAYMTEGARYAFYNLTYAYDWHDTDAVSVHFPDLMIPAMSDYRVPAIVSACAAADKDGYLYSSRRFGRGGTWVNNNYTVTFDSYNSNLRRDTWVTKHYTMGTISLDQSDNYISLIDQNRLFGIFNYADIDDRILFHGKATTGETAYTEIHGATGEDCMVVARDINASGSDGTRIFVSYGNFWNHRIENDSGWFFAQSGQTYVGFKIATGTDLPYFVIHSVTDGKMLDFEDMWSPVVFQTDLSTNYDTFSQFKSAVKNCSYSYSSGKLSYTSLAGDTYEIWRYSSNVPKINGTTVDLNPAALYSSPYLTGTHGHEFFNFDYPGYSDLWLHLANFGVQRDDFQTLALWHMDSTISEGGYTSVPDDDSESTSRNRHLRLSNGNPSLTTGDGGLYDEALDLDGDDYCVASVNWNSYPTVKCDVWFYPHSSASPQVLAGATSTWELHAGGQTCTFYMWDTNLAAHSLSIDNLALNTWHHATAICLDTGHMLLFVDDEMVHADYGPPMRLRSTTLYVGTKPGYSRYFDGLIDELKISTCETVD